MSVRRRFSVAGIVLLTLLVVISVFTGCNSESQTDSFGEITIALPSGATSRGTSSGLVTEIETYVITLTFQSDTSYTHTKTINKNDTTATFSALLPGTWVVAVDGFNASNIKVATGLTSASVESGKSKVVQITLVKAEGSGTLTVNTTWTDGLVNKDNVSITVTATLAGTQENSSITMNKVSSGASASGLTTLVEGNYLVSATFADTSNVYSDGRVTIAQVLADGETNVSFDFPLSVGGLNIDIQDPDFSMLDLSITGIGDAHYVAYGSTVTLAVAGAATPTSYQWYKNGTILTGETSSTLTIMIDAYMTYSLTCVVTEGDTSDSATVEFAGVEITEDTKDNSNAKFSEAMMLIETMFSEDAPVVNTRYLYNTLTEAVALNPNNIDAILTLGMFDLVKFLIDEDLQTVMREGIGFTTYPSTEQELYADILSVIYGFVPNGYNNFFKEHTYNKGEDSEYTIFLPVLSGYMTSDGDGLAYLLQMFSNLAAKGYDIDDVFDGILDSLGHSFDRTVNNIDSITDEARSQVATVYDDPYYVSKAEAQLISSQLYTIRALASLFNAIELGFDIENILDNITYDASNHSIEFATPTISPFADGFLQADSEAGLAYIASAKQDILKANELMSEALDAIKERTSSDDDLFVRPGSELFSNTSNGWTPNDMHLSWDEFTDILEVTNILLAKEKASIEAGGGTKVVIPIEIFEKIQYDSREDEYVFTNFAPIFATYSNLNNWPTVAAMDLNTGLNAVAFDAGVVFTGEFNLLATVLEIDRATGEPVLYYYNESNDTFSEATAFISGEYAYIKIPDITLGGFIDKANSPYLWSELEEMGQPAPFSQDYLMIREEDDAVAIYLLENLFTLPIAYPLSYHALDPAQSSSNVQIEFCPFFQNKKTGEYILTESSIPITSTGSFWLGAIEAIKYRDTWEMWQLNNLYNLDEPINDSKEHAYQLDQYVEMDFRWESDEIEHMPGSVWFSITPDESGTYCIEANMWNMTRDAKLYDSQNNETPLSRKTSVILTRGETYYVQYILNPYSNSCYYDIIWYEEDAFPDNYSYGTAKTLAVNTLFEGLTYGSADYIKIIPVTNQISISLVFSKPYPNTSYWSRQASLISPGYQEDTIDFEGGPQTFTVTPNQEYRICIYAAEYLAYTLQWNDIGE